MNQHSGQSDDRAAAIASLLQEVCQARASGRSATDASIIQAHPQLMPELGKELEKLHRIEVARQAAATKSSFDRTVEAPSRVSRFAGYSILQELSRGGQGVVYVATQLSTGRKVALKVLRDGPLADDRKLARFQREVQVLAALNHPNIVTIIDTGQTQDGSRYIVMNYIAGMDLNKYMLRRQQKDPDDPSKLLRMFLKICDAVNAAHQKGIVHRDLKPGNIRVDERGEPHVLDFGLAHTALSELAAGEQPLSVTGEFMGSLPWCSPEQAEGDPDKIDARTDVYSLGVILYQMLTGGRFPYKVVGNIRDVLNNILTAAPTPPSKLVAAAAKEARTASPEPRLHPTAVNETIERIVLKALSKDRHKRHLNAGEFKRDITNYLLGRQPQAPDPASANPVLRQILSQSQNAWSRIAPPLRLWLGNSSRFAGTALMRGASVTLVLGAIAIGVIALRPSVVSLWARVKHSDLLSKSQTVAIQPSTQPARSSPTTAVSRGMVAVVSAPAVVPPPIVPRQVASNQIISKPIVPAPAAPTTVDLLKMIEPGRDAVSGDWNWESPSGALVNSPASDTRIEFPYVPPDEYDFIVRFARISSERGIVLTGCASGHRYGWEVAGWGNSVCGFDRIDGRLANENETTTPFSLPDTGSHVSEVKVRSGRIEGYVDGKLICKVETDFRNWDVPPGEMLRRMDTLGFYAHLAGVRIESAEVKEVSGPGRRLAPDSTIRMRPNSQTVPPRSNATVTSAAPALGIAAPRERVWVNLLNGKDLAGWEPAPQARDTTWTVRNGILIGKGTQGYLVTRRTDYEDFQLKVEARIFRGGNSGVFFRVSGPVPDRAGYQAQISDSSDRDPSKTGSLTYYAATRELTRLQVQLRTSPVPPEQWFTMEITCVGKRITILVNGKQTVDFVDLENHPTHGAIAVEAFHATVQFRSIQIKELFPPK